MLLKFPVLLNQGMISPANSSRIYATPLFISDCFTDVVSGTNIEPE